MNRNYFQWAAFMPRKIVTNLSTIGPVGHILYAPGTWGSVIGIFLYVFLFMGMPDWSSLLLLLPLTYFSMGICNEAEIRFGKKDPGFIILDEVIAIPFCFLFLFPNGIVPEKLWLWLLLGFILFRIFDISKPWIIRKLQNIGGGIGVVIDDIVAAIFTNLCLQILFILFYG